ncbi:MAG: hypothetical protein IJD59_10460 [Clostridia bacterium]|nr:hypothetical protein [Clostridia bacterium]
MAVEIKCIHTDHDQVDSTVEVYQWFGWQLKSSQFGYGAQLVFERDKNISHYTDLVALENEFFNLIASHSQEPPYMPPHVKTMEDWARYFEPDLRTDEEKRKIHIGYGIAMGVCITAGWVVVGALQYGDLIDFEIMEGLLSGGTVGISALIGSLWYHALKRKRMAVLKKALISEQSEYRRRLQAKYDATIKKIQNYEQCKQRIEEIRDIAYSFLNN